MTKLLALLSTLPLTTACGDDAQDVSCAPPWTASPVSPREGWYDVPVADHLAGVRRFAVQYSGHISIDYVASGEVAMPAMVGPDGCMFAADGTTICATGVTVTNSAVLMLDGATICGKWVSWLD